MSDDNTMRETVRRARELRAFVSAKPDDWSEHNALIAAGLCNDELPALCDDNEQLRAKSARVTAERDEAFGRLARYLDEGEDPLPLPDDLTTVEGASRALLDAGRALDVSAGFLVDADPAHAAEVDADLDEQLGRVQAARAALRALRGW